MPERMGMSEAQHPRPAGGAQLRPARQEDVPQIVRIEDNSFAHAAERFDARRIAYLIRSRRVIVSVADRGDDVVGWCATALQRVSRPDWARIYALAVDPQRRGLRIGRQLLEEALAAVQALGAERVYLEVRADNAPAIRLYRSLGFIAHRDLRDYYAAGLHAVRMLRQIDGQRRGDGGAGGAAHSP